MKETDKSGTKNKTVEVYNTDYFRKSHAFVVCWSYPDGGSFQV